MVYKGFCGPTYSLQSVAADCQRTINLIPQQDESGQGKAAITFVGTPGLEVFCTLGTEPTRCLYTASTGRLFAVAGILLYEIRADRSWVSLGTLQSHLGVVSMTDNGTSLFIVDGRNAYTLTLLNNQFAVVTSENFHGGDTVAFQDGYFIFNQPGTQNFWISGLYSTSIDGLSYAAAEGSPDVLLSLLSDGQNVWLFGQTSTEVWNDTGDANFPFARIPGALIKRGCAAKFSPKLLENTVFWLANDEYGNGIVLRAQGYAPVRVSTHAMEQEIQRYPTIADAEAWTYQEDGHSFYVLNFPSASKTWAYDAITGMWHERAYTDRGTLTQGLARNHAFAFSQHIVGSYKDGTIYRQSASIYADAGGTITRIRRAPVINSENKRLQFSAIEFDMQTGVGDNNTPDPQAIMRFSNDSAQTWSNERTASIGRIGQTQRRVRFTRLGQARNRVYELKVTDPVPVFIQNAYLEVAGANS